MSPGSSEVAERLPAAGVFGAELAGPPRVPEPLVQDSTPLRQVFVRLGQDRGRAEGRLHQLLLVVGRRGEVGDQAAVNVPCLAVRLGGLRVLSYQVSDLPSVRHIMPGCTSARPARTARARCSSIALQAI
jgi:hypothetical protein